MITRKDLSDEQERALQYMLDFAVGAARQMILAGYAGTGKTTLVNVFLNEVRKVRRHAKSTCTAPTNEAVRVLSITTGEDFEKTIFSLLGLVLIEEEGQKPYIKQIGKPKLEEYDLVVLDEASMVGDELLSKIETQLKSHPNIKMIYVGDDAQLPPVNTVVDENNQEVECVESTVFKLKNRVNLIEVQRVSKDNPIIKIVTPIRSKIDSPIDLFERKTMLTENGNGVEFHDNRDEFMEMMYDDFVTDEYKKNSNYVRAIAYTNKAVNAMNLHIRRRIFETKTLDQFMIGENLIVSSPVMVKINKYVTDILFTVGERLRVKQADIVKDIEHGFRVWELTVVNYEAKAPKQHKIKVIHEEDAHLYKATLSELSVEAKERELMKTTRKGKVVNMYSKGEAWSHYYRFKNEFSWVKYSYAMTTHKSQGSTIERVYIIERDMNRLTWNDTIRNKLKYTAFTRASKLLRILQ
jgi:hypothetical protein